MCIPVVILGMVCCVGACRKSGRMVHEKKPGTISPPYVDSVIKARVDSFRIREKAVNDSVILKKAFKRVDSLRAEKEAPRQAPPPLPPYVPPKTGNKLPPGRG